MEEKLGVYICTGYGIGEALDVEALQKVATGEYKAAVCETIASCAAGDLATLRAAADEQQLSHLVLAGPSARRYTAGDLPENIVVETVNLLEWVVLTHPAGDEDTQMLAEDYLRMGIVRAKKTTAVTPFEEHTDLCKTIMVVGGGIAGLTAAREAADTGYQVVLVEKERQLGGYMKKLHRSVPTRPPYRDLEETGIESPDFGDDDTLRSMISDASWRSLRWTRSMRRSPAAAPWPSTAHTESFSACGVATGRLGFTT